MGEGLELVVTKREVLRRRSLRGGLRRSDYRWKINAAGNHKTLAVSSEGYNNLDDALDAAALVLGWQPARRVGTQRVSRGEL